MRKKILIFIGVGLVVLALIFSVWPYQLVACPTATLRVVNERGEPLSRIRVTRQWNTSEGREGREENLTDTKGIVVFPRIQFPMSLLKRVIKPVLIFVPVSCFGGWEVYGRAKFDVYWPAGYSFKFENDGSWKKFNAAYENSDGIHIYDSFSSSDDNCVGLYISNKRSDFQYTVKLQEDHTQRHQRN